MTYRNLAKIVLAPTLLLAACVTTTTTSRTWGEPYGSAWARRGHVEYVRETVRRQDGNPGAGGMVGALVGGMLGSAVGGHAHYDRWGNVYQRPSAAGAVVGAVGGAMVGAAASQGSTERRTYEVVVRFDDGGTDTFVYDDALPFRVGDEVALTRQGLVRV